MQKIVLLPGDGIGPEIVAEAVKVLDAIAGKFDLRFDYTQGLVGGASVEAQGQPLTQETLDLCKKADALLFGAVGGPQWDALPRPLRPEQAILRLRKELGLYTNLRPAYLFKALKDASPLKAEIIKDGLDLLVVRELTGGLYFGQPKGREEKDGSLRAFDTLEYSQGEIARAAHHAFRAAKKRRGKLTSVDKANVLETSRLWRQVVEEVAKEYPEVDLSHMYVDNCAMQLVLNPGQFDVIFTENTFGDILSDESSVITGSIGMLPSASLGDGGPFLYEPIHGSAPDLVGTGKANPIACILSAAMMLEYSFGEKEAAKAIRQGVEETLKEGFGTPDIAKDPLKVLTTSELGNQLVAHIKR